MKSRQCIRLYTVPIFGVKKVEQGCFENGQSQTTRLCTIFRLFFEKIIWSFGTILSGRSKNVGRNCEHKQEARKQLYTRILRGIGAPLE